MVSQAEFKKLRSKVNETLKLLKELKEYFMRITLDQYKLHVKIKELEAKLNEK